MKQRKPVPLSAEGSFEKIVNEGTSFRRAQTQKWYGNTLWVVITLLAAELINLILWQFGAIPAILSIFASEIVTCVVSFLAGRIYEKLCK